MYVLQWKTPALPGKSAINVPVGTVVSSAASVRFTGKGAANYGAIEQQNIMHLLENFAAPTPPDYATIGQTWFDSSTSTLKVLTDNLPATWKALGGVQVLPTAEGPPSSPSVGDLWFEITGSKSGFLHVYTGLGRFPYSTTTNGGWSQIWPRVDAAGLRLEYDQVATLTQFLASDASYVVGRLFTEVPDMVALDVDLLAKVTTPPLDPTVDNTPWFNPVTQPVSHDWDALLSMSRWLVSRLDLPSDAWADISGTPFVQDGRQVRDHLTRYSQTDPRRPRDTRRASHQIGSITMHRLYAETVNLLSAAAPFKYTLRGMAGASGTNSSFAPDVNSVVHARRAGSWTGGTAVANTTFRWNNAFERDRFVAGGSAIEIRVQLVGGGNANDVALNSFLNQTGRIRVTGDLVRWMDSAATPSMQIQPSAAGLANVITTAGLLTLGTHSSGGNTMVVTADRTGDGFNLAVTLSAPAPITGVLQVTFSVIQDRTTYDVTEDLLWPTPLPYVAGADSGGTTPALANVSVSQPPIPNFTVNGSTGPGQITVPTGSTVNFAFTGAGSPTLIEWDFTGDGNFTATGSTASTTYTLGVWSPRIRVTNAGGTTTLFRPGKIDAV